MNTEKHMPKSIPKLWEGFNWFLKNGNFKNYYFKSKI